MTDQTAQTGNSGSEDPMQEIIDTLKEHEFGDHVTVDESCPACKYPDFFSTEDGKTIRPGLRVFTNDWVWGSVATEQFTSNNQTGVNGPFFDGWFTVHLDNGITRIYNGERMTTRKPV